MGYQCVIWYIEMVIYHIDMVILDIDMRYGVMIREMTVSIWSSPISIWDGLSLCRGVLQQQVPVLRHHHVAAQLGFESKSCQQFIAV
jgi:hypothetical protein